MIILIANKKGGIGKTTTAQHLADLQTEKTLLIDTDGNLLTHYGIQAANEITQIKDNLFILFSYDVKKIPSFPVVIIDTRPDILQSRRLAKICDVIIIPCEMEEKSLSSTVQTIQEIKHKNMLLLPTKYRKYIKEDREYFKWARENIKIPFLPRDLHQIAGKSAWLIGELLKRQIKILKDRHENWKNQPEKNRGEEPLRSVYDWVEENRKELGFAPRQARNYIRLREQLDQDTADKVGVKKAQIIRTVKDKKAQEELLEETKDLGLSVQAVMRKAERVNERIEKKEVFETKIKPKLPKLPEMRLKKNGLILNFKNEKERDAFQIWLSQAWLKYSKEIYDLME